MSEGQNAIRIENGTFTICPMLTEVPSADSTNWFQIYKSMKRKYRDLQKVRVAAVAQDIQTIRNRISEHQRFHDEKVNEINEHTEVMRRTIDTTKTMKSEIRRLQVSVDTIKRSLKAQDSVLSIILKYHCFQVSVLRPSTYQVACGRQNEFLFRLVKDQDIHYHPIKVPHWTSLPPELALELRLRLSDLDDLCRTLNQNAELNRSN
jgi:hypothetical protein